MTCDAAETELIAYHFGVLSEEIRPELEAHLLGCARCLRSFVAIKRDIELGQAQAEPSPQAQARLRRAVAAELAPRTTQRTWRWWERPLAFGLAGAVVTLALLTTGAVDASDGAPPQSLQARQ